MDLLKLSIKFFFLFGLLVFGTLLIEKFGWLRVGIGFSILITCIIACAIWTERKEKYSLEEQRYNDYIANLDREISRPIIQAELAKQKINRLI